MSEPTEEEDRLEREAALVRERLLRTVDALDKKRHAVTRVATVAANPPKQVLVGALAAIGLAAGGVALFFLLRAKKPTPGEKLMQRLAKRAEPPMWRELARKGLLAILTAAITEGARIAAKRVGEAADRHG